MEKLIYLVVSISVIFVISTTSLNYIAYNKEVIEKIEEAVLDIQVDYATEATLQQLKEDTLNLGLEYTKQGVFTIDPVNALDEFSRIMVYAQDELPNSSNIEDFKNTKLKAFIVATYDGFYVNKPSRVNSFETINTFSMKKPYYYKYDENTHLALNLNMNEYIVFDDETNKITVEPATLLTEKEQRAIVNTVVSEEMQLAMLSSSYSKNIFYLPGELTQISTTNPIESLTVLAYLGDYSGSLGSRLESFSVGGAKAEARRPIGVYMRDGVRVYNYVDKVPTIYTIEEIYDTETEAAVEGYYVDLKTY